MTRAANREAATHLEHALSALAHMPEDRATLAEAIDLRIEMRHALWPLGEHGRILEHLDVAERVAEALPDQPRLARVLSTKGYCFWMLGDSERVVASNRRALAIARSSGDLGLEAAANFALGLAYHGLGDYREASAVLTDGIAALHGDRAYGRFGTAGVTSVLCMMALNWCQAEQGLFADGIATGTEAVRIAQVVDHKLSLMFADLGVGYLSLVQGDLARAIPTLERGLAMCRTWDFPSWLPWLASRVGAAYALAGRGAEGLPLLEQSVQQATAMGWKADASALYASLSEAYLRAGRVAEAHGPGIRALELAVEHKGRGHRAWALRLLGELASRRDRPDLDEAEARYREALAIADESGMRPLAAHCHAGLAAVARRIGKEPQAQEWLASATTMYREMGMTHWLTIGQAALTEAS